MPDKFQTGIGHCTGIFSADDEANNDMVQISRTITEYLAAHLSATNGLNATLGALRVADPHSPGDIRSFLSRNVTAELLEKANQASYPSVLVYCEKLSNTLREKFRTFSGTARMTVEVRHSEDRVEALDRATLVYTDAICVLLSNMRGSWTENLMYAGGYEVIYSPVKAGGKHFVQSSKITFEVDVSQ